jgi:hypothetical protein
VTPTYDSCHHKDTSIGDTFGGLGTSREFREEDLRQVLQAAAEHIAAEPLRADARRPRQ